MTNGGRPERGEASEYYFKYIDRVPDGDICSTLDAQGSATIDLLESVPADRAGFRYATDKWSLRQVVSHLNDTERLFVFRAFWFARGFQSPLPSFEPDIAVQQAEADSRSWQSHIDEFRSTRASTLDFFRGLPPEAWRRRGIASDNPFSVRALAYLCAGHVIHHVDIIREQYLRE